MLGQRPTGDLDVCLLYYTGKVHVGPQFHMLLSLQRWKASASSVTSGGGVAVKEANASYCTREHEHQEMF